MTSASVAQVATDWSGIPLDKIDVIPNAIDQFRFRDTGLRPVQTAPTVRIGFVGRLDPIKRIPDLVEAISHLDPQYHLHIYGDGTERATIESHIDFFFQAEDGIRDA